MADRIITSQFTSTTGPALELLGGDDVYISRTGLLATTTGFNAALIYYASGSVITNFGEIGNPTGAAVVGLSFVTNSVEIVNFGFISGNLESLLLQDGSDVVINRGTINGGIVLRGGADLYDGRVGLIDGLVSGGSGNDTIIGGLGADQMNGGGDNDTLYFDSEDLRYGAVIGGTGYDTGYYTDETTPLTINMQAQGLEGYFGSAADETVIAGNLGGFGLFASTGAGNDLIEGTTVGDNINGGSGIDVLYGRGGLDDLAGGLGGDWIQGGTGADTFRYNALTDSTVNGQDFIADFSAAEGDKINLTNALAGLPAPTFNTGFGTGTSVYVFAGGGGTSLVQVYTAATLQMQIVVSQATLAASDFVL